jgi:hypothetical protein
MSVRDCPPRDISKGTIRAGGVTPKTPPAASNRVPIRLDDHRWIEVGSAEWQGEVMQAINELIDRVRYLEARCGVTYDRMQRRYEPSAPD